MPLKTGCGSWLKKGGTEKASRPLVPGVGVEPTTGAVYPRSPEPGMLGGAGNTADAARDATPVFPGRHSFSSRLTGNGFRFRSPAPDAVAPCAAALTPSAVRPPALQPGDARPGCAVSFPAARFRTRFRRRHGCRWAGLDPGDGAAPSARAGFCPRRTASRRRAPCRNCTGAPEHRGAAAYGRAAYMVCGRRVSAPAEFHGDASGPESNERTRDGAPSYGAGACVECPMDTQGTAAESVPVGCRRYARRPRGVMED